MKCCANTKDGENGNKLEGTTHKLDWQKNNNYKKVENLLPKTRKVKKVKIINAHNMFGC